MSSREARSLQHRWTAYHHLPTLTEHWYWRPGWRPDRQFYTWHLTFKHQPDLHQFVTELQDRLALPGLDLVPLDCLHLTMQGVGFVDEVSDSDIDAVVAEARRRCADLAPLRLSLGPVDPDAEGIGLLVTPWQPVEQLRDRIRAAIGAVWPSVPEPADGFRPHVTIAYSRKATSTAPIRERLAELRSLPAATATIHTASLIALRREHHTYRWSSVATLTLGA
ncbi:2'-5' RNA ligase family protein [Micromonospora sp. NPDC050980]|uniref:2'-5' RNA ligase family protein n=1 Tax=Micromonospora sp. NPDC050980 TaxID=3155161 RepID=UPI0033D8AE01